VVCTTDNECLEADECEPSDGRCSFTSKDNGTTCGTTGMCRSGACEGDGVVDPQGGTGPGGNGPGGADSGGTSSAGEGSGDTGGGGNSGSNAGGEADQTPLYKRDPGGCACRLPAPARGHDHAAFGALVVLALVARRRLRAA
jgi:MYXO-CTERM domain-containing protein